MTNLLSLNWKQVGVSAFGAVFVAVVSALNTAVQGGSFDPLSYDWHSLGSIALKAFIGFVIAHLLTDANGNPLGIGSPKVGQV